MEKYVTLVFRYESDSELDDIRNYSADERCRAWSMDHELFRGDLVRQAVENRDIGKAMEYIGAMDIVDYMSDIIAELPCKYPSQTRHMGDIEMTEKNCNTCVFKKGKSYACGGCFRRHSKKEDNWIIRPSLKSKK